MLTGRYEVCKTSSFEMLSHRNYFCTFHASAIDMDIIKSPLCSGYLVGGEPSCLGVYLEVLVRGDDAVLDLARGVQRVVLRVLVPRPHLDHRRLCNART